MDINELKRTHQAFYQIGREPRMKRMIGLTRCKDASLQLQSRDHVRARDARAARDAAEDVQGLAPQQPAAPG